jgi:hypothetical protein
MLTALTSLRLRVRACSMDLALQSFLLHVIGPRFDLPEFLRCALEAAVLRKPADCDPHLFPIVTKIARGDSARRA